MYLKIFGTKIILSSRFIPHSLFHHKPYPKLEQKNGMLHNDVFLKLLLIFIILKCYNLQIKNIKLHIVTDIKKTDAFV